MPDCPDSGNFNASEAFPYENTETGVAETQPSDGGPTTESVVPETAVEELKTEITDGGKIPLRPADSLTGRPVPENNGVIFEFQNESNSDKDNHLGKGLIKPTSIQVAIDGYHFSYEKPTPRFAKAESFMKETAAEKRVVNPEFDISASKPETVQPLIGKYEPVDLEKVIEEALRDPVPEESQTESDDQELDKIEADRIPVEMAEDEKEGISKDDPGLEEQEILLSEDEPLGSEPESPAELLPEEMAKTVAAEADPVLEAGPETASETGSEPELGLEAEPEPDSEPELAKTIETTFLAGRQTWFGVPLPSLYRVTNIGVVLVDSSNRSRQIPWEAIAGIRLKQSVVGKILGVGNIELLLEEGASSPVVIEGVLKPKEVLKKIEELLETAV